jgi:oxygen-dependent protoporphyrinogen oxidase
MSGRRPPVRVVVVGGGITGLTAAYRLVADGVEVTLVERDRRLGGMILTERHDGFVLEGGPDAFLAAKPGGRELCAALGVDLIGSHAAAARASVMWDGRLHPLPDGLQGVVPRRMRPILGSSLFSPAGKLRVVLGRVIPMSPDTTDESLAHFVRRRFGREMWDRLVEPLATGVYAGDGNELSLRATFPSLADSDRARPPPGSRAGATPAGPVFLTPGAGLGELVEALEQAIGGERIRTGIGASGIVNDGGGYRVMLDAGEPVAADAVIVATPAHAGAQLLETLDPEIGRELRAIPHVSTAVVTIAVPTAAVPRPVAGHGFVIPRATGSPVVACSLISSKLRDRAPAGWTLVRTFIGRAGQPDPLAWDDDTLIALARRELRRGMGVEADPALARVVRWPDALPQYTLGHLDRLARIARRLAAHPGLAVAGNTDRGIGIPDCIASADNAVAIVRRHADSLRLTR